MENNKNHQIIIVDDDPDFTDLIEKALKSCHPCPTVKALHSGVDLLEWLEISQRPRLILLDINMPGSSGFDVLRILKSIEMYKAIPVVMLTVSEDNKDVDDSYDYGASSFVTKPTSFLELVGRMQLLSQYWVNTAGILARSWPNLDEFRYN